MKGIVYSITLSVIMLFILLFVNSLMSSYQNVQKEFYSFTANKKTIDDYLAVKYSLQSIIGVGGSHEVNVSFPFSASVYDIGPQLEAFVQFVNTTYARSSFSNIKVNANNLLNVVNSGALTYDIVPYNVVVSKQPGNAEKIIISNITSLEGLYMTAKSDAFVSNEYWKNPGYVNGTFNFTFNEIGAPFYYMISNSTDSDYIIDFQKNNNSAGYIDVSFNFKQNEIVIAEDLIYSKGISGVTFMLDFMLPQSSTIVTVPLVDVEMSDYLNNTVINGTI